MHGVEQRGVGPSGAQAGKFSIQRRNGAVHAAIEIVLVECCLSFAGPPFCPESGVDP